jgi:hypothetical protein
VMELAAEASGAPTDAVTTDPGTAPTGPWPVWQRILFRFFFVYLLLQVAPWNWLSLLPGTGVVLRYPRMGIDWAVRAANDHVFHFYEKLTPLNGSGDTSWAWTQMWLYMSVALIACVVWSALDWRRTDYRRLNYWLRLALRFYVASAALSYGIIKIFGLQMLFPTTSQLATPLGDLLPMRFSWLFIGYSMPYQVFSGVMETVAGVLLLFRRTVTAGLLLATGAFMNVVMINLSYDVPVKLYASHLLLACLYLLALDAMRLANLLVLNRPTPATRAWDPIWTKRWQIWGARVVWALVIWNNLLVPFKNGYRRYSAMQTPPVGGPLKSGVYQVTRYVVNETAVPLTPGDTLRWSDLIIDSPMAGSIGTRDQVFWQRYGRGYFRFKPDTTTHLAAVWKTSTIPGDSTFLFTMRFEVPDTSTIRLHTVIRGDSIHVELLRKARHFPLAERQFHWLSEYNR